MSAIFSSSTDQADVLVGKPKKQPNSAPLTECPYDRAGLLSRYSLMFMLPIFRKGYKNQLDLDSIGSPPKVDRSRLLGARLERNYNRELLDRKSPSFIRALLRTFGPQLILFVFLDFTSKCIAYPMQTIALGWLIRDTGLYLASTSTTGNASLPEAPEVGQSQLIGDALWLMFFTWLAVVICHPFFFQTYHIGMKCRVAAGYMIYKKSLRLSQAALGETTIGQMVNLLSNDVNRFDQAVQLMPYALMAPLQTIVVLGLLAGFYLGLYPTLGCLATILIYMGSQTSMGRGFSKFRRQTAKRTDERVRLMNELIMAMRIIKMYAWEKPFEQLVYSARKREIATIGVASILKTINLTLFFVSSKIIVFVALIIYVYLGNPFTAELVFVSIGLANLVRISLTMFFPNAVAYCAETAVSCQRINRFLLLPEVNLSPVHYQASSDTLGCKHLISMTRVYAAWPNGGWDGRAGSVEHQVGASAVNPDNHWAVIRNLSIQVRARELMLIIGRVGAGKSSVLMSILGELPVASGRLEVNGRLSYASQEAWIFAGTVKDNILFGRPLNSSRYNQVLRVCSLERDLEILPDSDETIVGERGVSLSGGQKARVNLARALYFDADIYLLDDPLSAVDAPVARHIFNQSMRTFLRNKTVILATHQLQFLRHATRVLVLDRELPAAFGSLEQVMQSAAFEHINYGKDAFTDATTTSAADLSEPEDVAANSDGSGEPRRSIRLSRKSSESSQRKEKTTTDTTKTSSSSPSASSSKSSSPLTQLASGDTDSADRLLDESSRLARAVSQVSSTISESQRDVSVQPLSGEKKKTGSGRNQAEQLSAISSDCSTYLYYLGKASGPIMFIWFVLVNVAAQSVYVYTDYFLSFWTDSVERQKVAEDTGSAFQPITFVDNLSLGEISGVYGLLVALCFFTAFARVATLFVGTLRASINIHDHLFGGLINAPMRFFDFLPIGLLLNRLSRDIGFVDETLPATAVEIVTIFVNISGILILTMIIDPSNIGSSLILLAGAVLLRNICSGTISRLKQIEGVSRSPIFSHLSTTLAGLPTIRAFRVQDDFIKRFDIQQDQHSAAWFAYICSNRWLTVAMDWLCLAFISVVVSLLLGFRLSSSNASTVGLLISQLVVLPGPFQWGMRQLIELQSQMTSVQRVRELAQVESEKETLLVKDDKQQLDERLVSYKAGLITTRMEHERRRKSQEEEAGEIRFIDVSLRYFRDESPVLRNLHFVIEPREKVAIVGRTGAGKSSIVAALFRLYEFEGTIEIDGRDTKTLLPNELRKCMSIIPQDPVLFGGTIRKNLDPFNEHSDERLWEALESCQLKQVFSRTHQGLDYVISEAGANFSVGQRQLICLARAIVRRNRILILDEATANVDPETDAFIQRTIGEQFAGCTVITIAHRLITIVDADRVLVLDRGQVSQFDEPHKLLLDKPEGLFAQMVRSSPLQAARLTALIRAAHERRQIRASSGQQTSQQFRSRP